MVDSLVFGRRLRHFRKRAGLTLKQLGERVGRPAPYLSMVENGRRPPGDVAALADALGIAVGDLLSEEAPTPRSALEIELERAQGDHSALGLPYVRPSPTLPDDVLSHLVGLYRALDEGVSASGRSRLRRANGAVGELLRSRRGYLADVESVAVEALALAGHDGDGPISSRTLLDLAGRLGFSIEAVDDMVPGLRSATDLARGRIYIAQRNELRTRQARKAILQTLAGRLLHHPPPDDVEELLVQRMETAYLAAAILMPEESALPRLHTAMERRDLAIEDLKELFYVSYEMAAWRFVNLATRHLDIHTHLLVVGEDGVVVKGYANDGVPLRTDPAGGYEAQPVCRRWGAAAVFESPDKFDVHAQYTDTPAGTYFCVTHMEPDRPYAVTVGVPFRAAQWMRGRETERRAESRCPDDACCLLPTPEQRRRWDGRVEASVRTQATILGRLAPDPYPPPVDRRVYELVERHA